MPLLEHAVCSMLNSARRLDCVTFVCAVRHIERRDVDIFSSFVPRTRRLYGHMPADQKAALRPASCVVVAALTYGCGRWRFLDCA